MARKPYWGRCPHCHADLTVRQVVLTVDVSVTSIELARRLGLSQAYAHKLQTIRRYLTDSEIQRETGVKKLYVRAVKARAKGFKPKD